MIEQIKKYTKTKWLGTNIIYEELMDSTNTRAKMVGGENVMKQAVVVAKRQTAGRGRRGRNWISPEGNCYFSILIKPDIQVENAPVITLVAALALTQAIKNVTELDTQIKWPNDVVVNGKKLCGILTESSVGNDGLEYVVIGIGINANQKRFDLELESMATSIILQTNQMVDCAHMIGEFLNCFENTFEVFLDKEDMTDLMDRYNSLLVNRNREVRIIDRGERIGTAIGINEKGELLVCGADGDVETVVSGEVSVRGLYGYV
ncbi:MAG: biotin--[Lachnospiraceae bacterium]|nr:biotin--[acetyl-CoA-carboxylase] ligase [Lachnospiraceae bacterium]